MAKTLTTTISLGDLIKLFKLPDPDEYETSGDSYSYGYKEAIDEGLSESEAEERGLKYEQSDQDEAFAQIHGGIMHVADRLFGEHGLVLVPKGKGKHPWEFTLKPAKSWKDAGYEIVKTINGVGMFEFSSLKDALDSGPYTEREFVLSHRHWIKQWPEVYGEGRPRSMFDRYLR